MSALGLRAEQGKTRAAMPEAASRQILWRWREPAKLSLHEAGKRNTGSVAHVRTDLSCPQRSLLLGILSPWHTEAGPN